MFGYYVECKTCRWSHSFNTERDLDIKNGCIEFCSKCDGDRHFMIITKKNLKDVIV